MLEKNGAIYTKNMKKLLCAGVAQETLLLPKKVKRIAPYSFSGNTTEKKVVITKSVTCLSKRCFAFSNIQEISFPESLEIIDRWAFSESNLRSAYIPANVKMLDGAFDSTANMISFEVSPDNQYYCSDSDGVIFNKDKIIFSGPWCKSSVMSNKSVVILLIN